MKPSLLLKKYPAPRYGEIFVERWVEFLPQIMKRENFHDSHLTQLTILCSLYEEFEKLSASLEFTGYSYESTTMRGGTSFKPMPEVAQLNVCRSQIAIYTRMLGLMLVKDMSPVNNSKNQEGNWD
jgi:phage terminase small subunit